MHANSHALNEFLHSKHKERTQRELRENMSASKNCIQSDGSIPKKDDFFYEKL